MTTALHHYPRRFRWEAEPPDDKGRERASLYIGRRYLGGVIRYSTGCGWSASLASYDEGRETEHRRRRDAKRAVECAAVTAEESRETT